MSFSDILEEFSGNCNDQTIIKGKRSKRPRPSSSDESLCNSPEDDDEDMANCLILLARGAGASQTTTNNIKPADNDSNKFTSRKFTETSVTAAGTGGGGAYVYECKTCSRAFPSFQALGGHRASHKKPKILVAADADRKKSPPTVSTQSPNNGNLSKSHECSVCGSEFGSGQALGGHMRRHRSTTTASAVVGATKTISEEEEEEKKRIVVGLDLDLNLPAPTEDGHDHDQHHRREIEMGRRWWIATTEAAAGLTF